MAAALQLRPGYERAAEHARRLKLASYGLAFSGLAVGGLSLAAGLRGREIENACDSEESCSHALAGHGRMLYRSADAGAAIAGMCGISAAILLWRWLSVSSPDGLRSASAEEHQTSASTSSWLFTF